MFKKITHILLFFSLLNTALYQPIRAELSFTKAALIGAVGAASGALFAYAYFKPKQIKSLFASAEIKGFNKERDLNAVADLFAANSAQIDGSTREEMLSNISKDLPRGLQLKVMYEKEQLVGFVSYVIHVEDGIGHVGVLCVDEKYRNKGYGKQLLHAAFEEIWKSDVSRIEWAVKKNNTNACEFYEKIGALVMPPWYSSPYYVCVYFRSSLAEIIFKAQMMFMRMRLLFS